MVVTAVPGVRMPDHAQVGRIGQAVMHVPAFAGAVYKPEAEIFPKAAFQLTDLFPAVP